MHRTPPGVIDRPRRLLPPDVDDDDDADEDEDEDKDKDYEDDDEDILVEKIVTINTVIFSTNYFIVVFL